MSEDQFTKLYKYMQMEFGKLHEEIDQRFGEVHERLSQVYDLVDNDFNRRDTDELERLAMSSQLDRHEGWISQLADATKTKLTPRG